MIVAHGTVGLESEAMRATARSIFALAYVLCAGCLFGTAASPRAVLPPAPAAVAVAVADPVPVPGPVPVSVSASASVSVPVPTALSATVTLAAPTIAGPPAVAYGGLTGDACEALLTQRNIPYARVASARGVDRPVRLTGRLHGVDFHGGEPPDQRTTSPTEIVDCRMALALDDFAVILATHGIKEAVHFSIYRAAPGGTPLDAATTDHQAALAIDLAALIESDDSRTGVLEDWKGGVGTKTCGKWAGPQPVTKRGQRLRAILCETAAAQMFHLVLTPNFNDAHHDHFHLEVKRGSTWFLVK